MCWFLSRVAMWMMWSLKTYWFSQARLSLLPAFFSPTPHLSVGLSVQNMILIWIPIGFPMKTLIQTNPRQPDDVEKVCYRPSALL